MKRLMCAMALVLGGTATAGCATVNVGAAAGDVASTVDKSSTTPTQREMRAASAAFVDQADAAGWTDDDSMGEAARRTIDVLLHGRDAAEEAVTTDRAAAYIEARALADADAATLAGALVGDIRSARAQVRAVNALADAVIDGPARASWSRREDVDAVENVVRAARQSYDLFDSVAADRRITAASRPAVTRELSAFELELERLSVAADALSMGRPRTNEADTVASIAAADLDRS